LGEKLGIIDQLNWRVSVLAMLGSFNFSAESVRHKLQAVTDSQHRHTELKDFRISYGRICVINRRRAAGKNYSDGRMLANFGDRGVARKNHREDVLLANAARD